MKNIILVPFLLFSTSAFSDISTQASSSVGSATGGANITSYGSDLAQSVPTVTSPGLSTTLTETCMGSTSGGVGVAGFGVSGGTTWSDENCVRRLDSRHLAAMGDLATARELMCNNEEVREAAKRVGRPCLADGGTPYGVITTSAPQTQPILQNPNLESEL